MPLSTFLIIAGLVLFSLGLVKLSSGHDTGFNLNNSGFAIFRIEAQSIAMSGAVPQAPQTDWASLAAAGFGLVLAGAGLTITIFDWLKG